MTDIQIVVIVSVVAGTLGSPWWYAPLCTIVIVAVRWVLDGEWRIGGHYTSSIPLLAIILGMTIVVSWGLGWLIRQGLLRWRYHR